MSLDLKYGVSTWLWTSPFSTETISLFPKIKKMGYDVVEIPIEYPENIDAGKVKEALRENELGAIVCGAFGPNRDLTNDDPAIHDSCFAYIRQCLDFCNTWETGFFAGPMYSAVGKARMVPPDQRQKEWALAVENLQKVCRMAEERGLKLAIEPLNRFESDLINTAEDVVRLIGDINHAAAHVLLDGFHMNIEEPDIEKAILTAGDRLIHVQVSENYRGTPGTGQTNWQAYKAGLEKINYRGALSIESFTPEIKELAGAVCIWRNLAESQDAFASDGVDFLKKLFNN